LPNLQVMRHFLIATCFVFLLTACGKMEEPVFNSIENVRVSKLGTSLSMMTFDMQYFNPNKSRATLKEAEGEAWLDSNYIGHFHVDTIVSIPANSNFTVPVNLDVDMKYLLKYSLLGFRNEEVLVTVKGKAKVGKGWIYKKFPLHYEGKQNLAELIR
jgi:LEA14-like dessication related protein